MATSAGDVEIKAGSSVNSQGSGGSLSIVAGSGLNGGSLLLSTGFPESNGNPGASATVLAGSNLNLGTVSSSDFSGLVYIRSGSSELAGSGSVVISTGSGANAAGDIKVSGGDGEKAATVSISAGSGRCVF